MTQQDIHDFMTAQGFKKIDGLEIWYLQTGSTDISVWNADEARIMLQLTLEARRDERRKVAEAIWEDEQKANAALANLEPATSMYTNMCGRLLGLQRARDIAELNNQLSKDKSKDDNAL